MKNEKQEKNKISIKKIIFIIFLIGAALLAWARFISTYGITVKEYAIKASNLDSAYDGLKIVQFSDLHYGSTVDKKSLKKIIKKINDQNPDIVIFTGDLIEKDIFLRDTDLRKLATILNTIEPKVETLAVLGNHDYDSNYLNRIKDSLNWKFIDNTYEYYYDNSKTPLVFVGFDDLRYGKPDYNNAFSYLNETEEDLYTILVFHEPDQIDYVKDHKFDIAMSGHSHLGQVRLPFIGALWTPNGSKKYFDEHYKVNDADLFVSGGIGTSLLKLRFLNKPSINLYRFYTK